MTDTAKIVVVPVSHPEVAGAPRPAQPRDALAERQELARQHRAAARVAARSAAALVSEAPVAADAVTVVSRPSGAPALHLTEGGRTLPLDLGLSMSHANGWGAALVWRASRGGEA